MMSKRIVHPGLNKVVDEFESFHENNSEIISAIYDKWIQKM